MTDTKKSYQKIDPATLREGMLMERPLLAHLVKNDRYIVLARELWILEKRLLEKIQKLGHIVSSEPPIMERYPELQETVADVKRICSDENLAPFEKNAQLCKVLEWMIGKYFSESIPDVLPGVFLILRAFDVPLVETLQYVSEQSLSIYEDSLKTATTAGVLALWLGYCDVTFLKKFVPTVFATEIGVFAATLSDGVASVVTGHASLLSSHEQELFKARHKQTVDMIREGRVPGLQDVDHRLKCLILGTSRGVGVGDILHDIVSLSRWLVRQKSAMEGALKPIDNRAYQKLIGVLSLVDKMEVAA